MIRTFMAALAFLTILPIRFRVPASPIEVARSRYWYPVVGIILGGVIGATAWGLSLVAAPTVTAFLALVFWVAATGALHLDGCADCCDGLFGGKDSEERLRIMRDPHIGAFGVVAILLVLFGKAVALYELAVDVPAHQLAWRIGICVFTARCCALVVAGLAPYARAEGTGKLIIAAARPWEAFVAGLLIIAASVLFNHLAAVLALAAALLLGWMCRRRLGGVTGDCLGAAIELAETTCLLAFTFQLSL